MYHLRHVLFVTSSGIRSWDVDLKSCNLNLFLQEFLSHHTASLKGAGKKHFFTNEKVLCAQVLQMHSNCWSGTSSATTGSLRKEGRKVRSSFLIVMHGRNLRIGNNSNLEPVLHVLYICLWALDLFNMPVMKS